MSSSSSSSSSSSAGADEKSADVVLSYGSTSKHGDLSFTLEFLEKDAPFVVFGETPVILDVGVLGKSGNLTLCLDLCIGPAKTACTLIPFEVDIVFNRQLSDGPHAILAGDKLCIGTYASAPGVLRLKKHFVTPGRRTTVTQARQVHALYRRVPNKFSFVHILCYVFDYTMEADAQAMEVEPEPKEDDRDERRKHPRRNPVRAVRVKNTE